MPLPAPDCERAARHTRTITVSSFRRSDALWDVEGHLTDVCPYAVPLPGGMLDAHQPMHSMWVRLTVDSTLTIVGAQAITDAGPYGTAACGAITPDYQQLVGVAIARGYRDTIRKLFGRTAGCTHINELLGAMGTAAMQAMWEVLTQDPAQKPFSIDGCHALKSDGPQVAQFFPRWYRPAAGESTGETTGETTGASASDDTKR